MLICDRAAATSHEVTPEGFVRLKARIARAGLHDYRPAEVGNPPGFAPEGTIRVWRPPDEVFDLASLDSFRAKPVTDDHPPEMVDARNWRRYAVGQSGPQVVREGDHLVCELTIHDAAAAARALAGAELSNGYFADFVFEPGTTPEGEPYDAVQRNIRGNHIALVDAGRCGPSCRVGDCDCGTVRDLRSKIAELEEGHAEALAAKDGEIAALSLEHLEAGAMDRQVTERIAVIDAARAHFGPGFSAVGRSASAIRRLVVADALGAEKVRERSDAYVAAAFDALVALRADLNPLATHLARHGGPEPRTALVARDRYLTSAWKGEPQGDA